MGRVSTFIATGLAIKYRYSSLWALAEVYTILFFASRARPIESAGGKKRKAKKEEEKREKNSKEASRRGSGRFQSFHQVHWRESLRGSSSSTNLADLDRPRLPRSGNRYSHSLGHYYVNRIVWLFLIQWWMSTRSICSLDGSIKIVLKY